MTDNHSRLGGKLKSCSGVMQMEGIEERAVARNSWYQVFRVRSRSDANVSNGKSEYTPGNDFRFYFCTVNLKVSEVPLPQK